MSPQLLRLFAFFFFLGFLNSAQAQPQPADTASNNGNAVFEKAEVEASVNTKAWIQHLQTNLVLYIDEAVRKGIKPGTYRVDVRFLVEKNGRITDVKALNDPGYGLALGAVRTVRTGPLWTAGEVAGQKVRSYHTQPISFAHYGEMKTMKRTTQTRFVRRAASLSETKSVFLKKCEP